MEDAGEMNSDIKVEGSGEMKRQREGKRLDKV